MKPVSFITMTREQALEYINTAPTKAERNLRKAKVMHILYGNSRSLKELLADCKRKK